MKNESLFRFFCKSCNAEYLLSKPIWRCVCGSFLDIKFKGKIDPAKIKKEIFSLWRYREFLPIEKDENIVSFGEGLTPLVKLQIYKKEFFAKLEFLFPTGSFKDRGATVLVSKIKELKIKKVVEDSSGNAGCAISAYCAKAGIDCEIFVPENASPAKISQIKIYGAKINAIKGTRDEVAKKALISAEKSYYASHVWNPFFFHGTKTFSYEIWEQLGFKEPDTILLPVGNGTLLIGAYIGFKELFDSGLTGKIPRFVAIQAENCSPIYKIFKENLKNMPEIETKKTIAEGISVAKPARWQNIIKIIKETGGDVIVVKEEEIIESAFELAREGIYVEPTSATAIAGLKKYEVKDNEIIVIPLTGHGLKSMENYLKFLEV